MKNEETEEEMEEEIEEDSEKEIEEKVKEKEKEKDESEEEDRKCELSKDKANNICFDCSFYLCDNCFEYLHNKKVNSEHKKEEIEPLISIDFKCREHPIVPMNLFCIKENSKIYIYIIFK